MLQEPRCVRRYNRGALSSHTGCSKVRVCLWGGVVTSRYYRLDLSLTCGHVNNRVGPKPISWSAIRSALRPTSAEMHAARIGVTERESVADLTAHRTLGLRLALSEQPDVALVAVTHALVAQTFYRGAEANVLDIRPGSLFLGSHADGIADTEAGLSWSDRHARWAAQLPRDVADLWAFVVALDHDSRMAIFAHCAALTVNAVKLPRDHRPRALATADSLAEAVALDMTGYWRPTVRTYFGRVTKARIIEAVREAVSAEAADRMADMKKPDMAEAAEQLLATTDWLPALIRLPKAAQQDVTQSAADAATDGPANAYANAAE